MWLLTDDILILLNSSSTYFFILIKCLNNWYSINYGSGSSNRHNKIMIDISVSFSD